MRLDKFLKVSGIIKRRVIAKSAAEHDIIFINDKLAKPATMVKADDIITLHFNAKILTIKVLSTTFERNTLMFEILSEVRKS